MLEENNPKDFMDVFLQQMEAESTVDNSAFTGNFIISTIWVHEVWLKYFTFCSGVTLRKL
jgi:hypothetical protein